MAIKSDRGTPWTQIGSSTSLLTVTQTGTTGQLLFVTDISVGSIGGSGTWAIYGSTATLLTPLWQGSYGTSTSYAQHFDPALTPGATNVSVKLQVGGLTYIYGNLNGYIIDTP